MRCQKEANYSDENTILAVSIPNINSSVSISEDKVVLNVDKSVDISNLTLLFEISPNATISPKSGLAHDFVNPVVFCVVSESGLSKPYTVSVVKESYGADKAIISCYLANILHSALISESSINIRVPKHTDITSLSLLFELSEFAAISPKSGVAQDFTNPVEYTVMAEDGTETKYMVTVVTAELSSESDVLSAELPNINHSVTITGNKIDIRVSKGVGLFSLSPLFEVSEFATISPKSGAAQSFLLPVEYTVTAEDGTEKKYMVTVTPAELSYENDVLAVELPNINHSVTITGNKIDIRISKEVNVSSLSPLFEVSEFASISPKSGSAQSFIRPVEYTVTAEDGTEKKYMITVVPAELSDKCDIASFTFSTKDYKQTSTEDGFHFEFYKHVNLAAIAPIIEISEFATISPKSGETVNLTMPVVYTVTAESGATRQITVTGSQNLSNETEIKDFKFQGTKQELYQTGNNITIYVPYETDITHMQADVTVSDFATITPSAENYLDFTQPKSFTVTSSDGAYSTWVVDVKKSKWRCLIENGRAPFTRVDGHQMVVFKDKLWLIGGWVGNIDKSQATYEEYTSQIWNTTDGENWSKVCDAPWNGRHGFGCVVHDNKIWVWGGDLQTDVWNSEDGLNWTKILDVLPFKKRYFGNGVSYKGYLWSNIGDNLAASLEADTFDETWYSSNGSTWTKAFVTPMFAPRGLISGNVIINDTWYMIGGALLQQNVFYNDVWSTTDGIYWKSITHNAGWQGKRWISVAAFDNKMWVIGGDNPPGDPMYTNEVWSSSNGKDWERQKGVFWEPRHACYSIEYRGRLYMVGGAKYNQYGVGDVTNEVWVMER